MKRFLYLAFVVMLLPAAPLAAESTSENPLDRIAWMVGTWIGEKKAADGTPEIVEVTFDWAGHKKIIFYKISSKQEDRTTTITEGMCGWHPGKKQLVLWEFDNEGNLYESVMVVHGNKQSYEEMLYQANGATTPVRAEVMRENDNRFSFKAFVPKNGEWPEVFHLTYDRVRN